MVRLSMLAFSGWKPWLDSRKDLCEGDRWLPVIRHDSRSWTKGTLSSQPKARAGQLKWNVGGFETFCGKECSTQRKGRQRMCVKHFHYGDGAVVQQETSNVTTAIGVRPAVDSQGKETRRRGKRASSSRTDTRAQGRTAGGSVKKETFQEELLSSPTTTPRTWDRLFVQGSVVQGVPARC